MRLDELELQFKIVAEAMRRLMGPPLRKRKQIGFLAKIPKK